MLSVGDETDGVFEAAGLAVPGAVTALMAPGGEPVAESRGRGTGFERVAAGADVPVGMAVATPARTPGADPVSDGAGTTAGTGGAGAAVGGSVPVAVHIDAGTAAPLPMRGGRVAAARPERAGGLVDGSNMAAASARAGPSDIAGAAPEITADVDTALAVLVARSPGGDTPGDRGNDASGAGPSSPADGAGAAAGAPAAPFTAMVTTAVRQAVIADAGPALAARPGDAAGAMLVTSERLGDVRIGLEGGPQDLRVSFAAAPGSAGVLAADAPRLAAELAANGLRLQSFDVSGAGAGGGSGLGTRSGDGRPARGSAADVASVFAGDAPASARDRRSLPSDRYA